MFSFTVSPVELCSPSSETVPALGVTARAETWTGAGFVIAAGCLPSPGMDETLPGRKERDSLWRTPIPLPLHRLLSGIPAHLQSSWRGDTAFLKTQSLLCTSYSILAWAPHQASARSARCMWLGLGPASPALRATLLLPHWPCR